MNNQEAIKRRYTFGNDEFSLEAAYHDCKLVFDGITDDDSFQEADTGLILYYANEIIYALHEAFEGKDTNVPIKDTIYRQAAIDALNKKRIKTMEKGKDVDLIWECLDVVAQVPSAQPEQRWIPCSERLPGKEKKTYWVCTDAEYQCECRWTNNRFGLSEGEWGWSIFDTPQYTKPIAWMPLLEPYKEEQGGEHMNLIERKELIHHKALKLTEFIDNAFPREMTIHEIREALKETISTIESEEFERSFYEYGEWGER